MTDPTTSPAAGRYASLREVVPQYLAKHIVALREERGWSQQELAVKAKVSKSYLSQIESANRKPAAGVLLKLARALGVSIPALLGAQPGAAAVVGAAAGGLVGAPIFGAAAGAAASAQQRRRSASACDGGPAGPPNDEAWAHALDVLTALTQEELARVIAFAEALRASRPNI